MNTHDDDLVITQRRFARIAGIAYITNYATAVFGAVTPGAIAGGGTFAERAARVHSAEVLYRAALTSMSVSWILIVVLAYALYITLAPVHKRLAQIALLMEICQASIGAVTVMWSFAALGLYTDPGITGASEGMHAAMSAAGGAGFQIAMMFLGAGSTIYFTLFYRSGYLPRIISAWGIGASIVFFGVSVLILIFPDKARTLQMGWAPMGIAEILTGLWLIAGRLRMDSGSQITLSKPEPA